MSLSDLLLKKSIGCRPVGSAYHTVFDWQSVRRLLIHHWNIQIAVKNDRQCSRDRRCAHNQHMRLPTIALHRQLFPLSDAKAVLFICHDQCQLIIYSLFLKECLSTDDDICFMIFNPAVRLPFGSRRHRSGQQNRFYTKWCIQCLQVLIVLSGKHFRRCHHTALKSCLRCRKHRQCCDHRLPWAHISLNKPVHNDRALHIFFDFMPDPQLRLCQMIRQWCDQLRNCRRFLNLIMILYLMIFFFQLLHRQCKNKKFIKNQSFSRHPTCLFIFWKMNLSQGIIVFWKLILSANIRWQRIRQ